MSIFKRKCTPSKQEANMAKCAVAALTTPAAGCLHCITPLCSSDGSFSLRDGEQSFIQNISSL